MIKDWTIWIKIILLTFSLSLSAVEKDAIDKKGNFSSLQDQNLVNYQLDRFARECGFLSSHEQKLLQEFNEVFKSLDPKKNSAVYSCYENNLPKMKSIAYLYDKLCKDLNYSGIPAASSKLLSQFVAVNEYKDGISLHHTVLNDCLKGAGAQAKWVVSTESSYSLATELERKLRSLGTGFSFFPNRLEIR